MNFHFNDEICDHKLINKIINNIVIDTKEVVTESDQTFSGLLNELSTISDEKINTIPFAGSWTAGQLAQHVILSADGIVQLLNGPVKDTGRDPEANIPKLEAIFLDFTSKYQSPDFIVPEYKNYDKHELINSLQNIKTGLHKAIETLDTTKTCTAFELPGSGFITSAEEL